MNKGELVNQVSEVTEITKKDVELVLGQAIATIMDAVATGDKVTLVGFGVFESRSRKARRGRNPKTGDDIQIPAATIPGFTAGKLFKEKVGNSK